MGHPPVRNKISVSALSPPSVPRRRSSLDQSATDRGTLSPPPPASLAIASVSPTTTSERPQGEVKAGRRDGRRASFSPLPLLERLRLSRRNGNAGEDQEVKSTSPVGRPISELGTEEAVTSATPSSLIECDINRRPIDVRRAVPVDSTPPVMRLSSSLNSIQLPAMSPMTPPITPYPSRPKLRVGVSYTPPPSYSLSPQSPFGDPHMLTRSESVDLGILPEADENEHHQPASTGATQICRLESSKGSEHRPHSQATATRSHRTPVANQQVWLCTPPPASNQASTPTASALPISSSLPDSPILNSTLSLPLTTPRCTPKRMTKPLVTRATSTGKAAMMYEGGCISTHCERVLKGRVSMSPSIGRRRTEG